MAADTAVAVCMVGVVGVLAYLAMSIDKNNEFLMPLRAGILVLDFHFAWGVLAYASVVSTGISTAAANIVNKILTIMTWTKWLVTIVLILYIIYWIMDTARKKIEDKKAKKNGRKPY